jgi:glycine/D-amino acid oxidase-like deaminating enzyme
MRIIVIGAGIGGLAAALTLGRSGFEVQLFEQASVLREIGAGVQINPNATRIRDWRTITCPSAQRWMTTAARSHSETAQRLLKSESTGADHAIAGFPNSGFRKFLLGRLQLLNTRNVRSDEVVDAHVFYDDNGRSRGFGAVRMSKAGFRAATEARACATDCGPEARMWRGRRTGRRSPHAAAGASGLASNRAAPTPRAAWASEPWRTARAALRPPGCFENRRLSSTGG